MSEPALEQLPEQGPGGPGGRSTRALSLQALMPLNGLRVLDLGCDAGYDVFDLLDCRRAKVFVLARVREPKRDIPVAPLEADPIA